MIWRGDQRLYIGDALFPGDNDETVAGFIPTIPVKDCRETFEYFTRVLKYLSTKKTQKFNKSLHRTRVVAILKN